MQQLLRSRVTVACVTALATGAVAVGGTALAAGGKSRTPSPLSAKQRRAVNGLIASYVKKHGRRGPTGKAGAAGPAGATGPAGPAGADGVAAVSEAFGPWQWADSGGRYAVAICPAGTVPTGGGFEVNYWNPTTNATLENDGRIVVRYAQANDSNGDQRADGWTAAATMAPGTTPPSGYRPEVTANAVCAPGSATARVRRATAGSGARIRQNRPPAAPARR
ncbi:hypothetical protein [Patulibacter defluvii]|uniref:hypothetical protein n=1 Tax=Patulibacter defluvii TaxID=3095358 RepID=UPI002A75A422|nr:hypothetical protein [Patulibacter sp. DM4]